MNQIQQKNVNPRIPINRCHLYGIQSPHALAKRLGWDLGKLKQLAENGRYRVFKHKKTGRMIQEPGPALQGLHRQFHKYLSRIDTPDYLQSAVKGRSYISNARAHIGKNELFKVDISKFYQNVPQHRVMHFFRENLNCAPDVAGLLANLICFNRKLATGSSVSPIISYYSYKNLFDSIQEIASTNGLTMTCYIDDITMSGASASREILHDVRTMIFRENLRAHKDRQFTIHAPKIVTGLIVGAQGIKLPFSRWKKVKEDIRHLKSSSDPNEKLAIYSRLASRLYESSQVDPRCRIKAEYYHSQWKALKRSIQHSPPVLQEIMP